MDAATLTGGVLVLEPADASNPGVVNTGTQSFAGSKTFDTLTTTGGFPSTSTTTGDLIVAGGAGIGGAVNVAATVSATGLALPDTNAAGSAGVIMFGGQRFVSDYGTNNTFVGANSGNTTLVVGSAFANTAVGRFALGALTSGNGNVGVGFAAGINLMNGSTNVGVGDGALLSAIGAGEMLPLVPMHCRRRQRTTVISRLGKVRWLRSMVAILILAWETKSCKI